MQPEELLFLRQAADVDRCHTLRLNKPHTVGAHSYNVAMICWYVMGNSCSSKLIMAALHHDLPEIVTGDLPATVKMANPNLEQELKIIEHEFFRAHRLVSKEQLSPLEQSVLKFSDTMELILHCYEESLLGNMHVKEVLFRARDILFERSHPFVNERARRLVSMVDELVFPGGID